MKANIRFAMTCSMSIICAAALVIGTTVIAVHTNNSTGKGGFDTNGSIAGADELLVLAGNQHKDELVAFIQENADLMEQETMDSELSYISYKVKKGDMVGSLAQKFGITQDAIISVNNIKNTRTLSIGQYLKIPSMTGILYTVKKDGETISDIATKYEVSLEQCASINNIAENDSLKAGRTVFVPGGQLDRFDLAEINGDIFKKPLHSGYYLTSYFGWRVNPFDSSKRSYHGGIDMACPQGTPIYAAQEGRVITAGWSNVYGNYVIIEHHSGYKTLYGHMSKILCAKGNYVYNTTKIGLVGSTGQSTGPHLHFTVYKNGTSINPLPLIN